MTEEMRDTYGFSEEFYNFLNLAGRQDPTLDESTIVGEPIEDEEALPDEDETDWQQEYNTLKEENELLRSQINNAPPPEVIQSDEVLNYVYNGDNSSSLLNMVLADDINGRDYSNLPVKSSAVSLSGVKGEIAEYVEGLVARFGDKVLITSANDQKHATGSKHYSGEAVDLRFDEELYDYIQKDPRARQLGLNTLDPNHGTAKHIHLQKRQYGGSLPEFGGGGKNPRKPITVNNPNHPRLKAYQDSLLLSNASDKQKYLRDFVFNNQGKVVFSDKLPEEIRKLGNKTFGQKEVDAIQRLHASPYKSTEYSGKLSNGETMHGQWSEWKKPVQPVVYQKPQPKSGNQKEFVKYFDDKDKFEQAQRLRNDSLLTYNKGRELVKRVQNTVERENPTSNYDKQFLGLYDRGYVGELEAGRSVRTNKLNVISTKNTPKMIADLLKTQSPNSSWTKTVKTALKAGDEWEKLPVKPYAMVTQAELPDFPIYKKPVVVPKLREREETFQTKRPIVPELAPREGKYIPTPATAPTLRQMETAQQPTDYVATWRDESLPDKTAKKYFNTLEEWKKFVYDNPDYNYQSSNYGTNSATSSGYKIRKYGGKYKVKI